MEKTRKAQQQAPRATADESLEAEGLSVGLASDETAPGEPSFDPEAAEEIWRLAARLQAQAARRLEGRTRAIANAEDTSLVAQEFTLSEVKEIGDEAGIDSQFIELALRQHAAQKHAPKAVSSKMSDTASRFLGTPEDHITVTRVIRAEKSKILEAMERLFPSEPFNLQLLEVIGDDDNLADSTLIFKVPQVEQAVSSSGVNMFAYRMSIADLNRMTVSLHAIDAQRTEVTVQLDLGFGKWRNFNYGAWIAGVFGAMGGLIALLIAAKKSALGIVGLSTLTAAITLILGYGTYWGYRLAYRSGLRKGQKEIEELLAQVDVNARTGGGFASGAARSG